MCYNPFRSLDCCGRCCFIWKFQQKSWFPVIRDCKDGKITMPGIFLQHMSASLFPWDRRESEEPIADCTVLYCFGEQRGESACKCFWRVWYRVDFICNQIQIQRYLEAILEANKITVIWVTVRMLMIREKEDMLSWNISFLVSFYKYICMYYAHLYTQVSKFHIWFLLSLLQRHTQWNESINWKCIRYLPTSDA